MQPMCINFSAKGSIEFDFNNLDNLTTLMNKISFECSFVQSTRTMIFFG